MVFLMMFMLSFASYAHNPIQNELENLNIESLFLKSKRTADIDHAKFDLNNKKKEDELTDYDEYTLNSNKVKWSDTEQTILSIKNNLKYLENMLEVNGSWGKVKLDINPRQKQKLNLKYDYGF